MLVLAALFLTAVAAVPITPGGPIVAVFPAGSNVTWTGALPETMYHRIEFQFLDFQMNQTAPFATNLVQNLEIYTNFTFGPHMTFSPSSENLTEGTWSGQIPSSVEGYTQLFNGLYNGGSDNKINIDRTITGDMCGMIFDKGYFDVWVRPTNAATAGAFHEGYYTCFYNLNFGTALIHEGESRWSGIFQCNSGNLNNYSFRLWYQYRFYNIEPKMCTQSGFFHAGI
ncbi:hypothetical protein BV898_16022 [Hypsibius exemplaris]|uniref:Uncharacterized protein n=1 Tax=Hypsibius exemplaris TaxID=2072580 RepID=A0A9X6RKT1_HYPEX|nr:hypothetical protein BV898_16022 [Hypsibius exemplaris]